MSLLDDLWDQGTEHLRENAEIWNWDSDQWVGYLGAPGMYHGYRGTAGFWDVFNPEMPPDAAAVIEINHDSNVGKIPVIYGTRGRVGCHRVTKFASGTNNEYLHLVCVICEGEIEAIDNVYIGGTISTDEKFTDLVTITKYLGTTSQTADPDLVADIDEYESTDRLQGIVYVSLKLKFNKEAFSGFPVITFDVRGKKVYDPRTDTTYFNANNALCLRDYLTDTMYGKGMDAAKLNSTYIEAAADYYDTAVQKYTGTGDTMALLECNVRLDTSRTILDNIRILIGSCRAGLPRINGLYCLIVEKDYPSSFSFDESNIIGGWSFDGTSRTTKRNEIEVSYVNSDLDWKSDTLLVQSAPYLAEDGGYILSEQISADYIVDPYRAEDLANLTMKRSRQRIAGSFVASHEAISVVPGSVVDISHTTPGWSAKKFRITSSTILANGLVSVSWVEHDPTVYDRDVPLEYVPPPDTTLPDPANVLPPTDIVVDSGDDHLLIGGDGTIISRIYATWTGPVGYPYTVGYDVEYQKEGGDWIPAPFVSATSGEVIHIGPVDDGVNYSVRIRTVGHDNMRSSWLTSAAHPVVGKTAPPPDVATFLVQRQSDGTRQFSWTMTSTPADLDGYIIRYRLGTGYVWDDMYTLHEGLLNASPFETNALAAGTYTVGIKAIDTSGNESANAKIIQSVLGDPRIGGSIYDYQVKHNGWEGTKTDCFVDSSDGELWAVGTDTWADLPPTWAGWTVWEMNPATSFSYVHPSASTSIDLGAILDFTPLIFIDGVGTITIEEQHSDDDSLFSSWAVVGTATITARYIRFRISVSESTYHGRLFDMAINLAANPVEEAINDLDISTLAACTPSPGCATSGFRIAVGDIRVPITKSFTVITQVQVALQNVGGGWSWEIVDKDTAVGPRIRIYNATPALADPPALDILVKGV